VTSRRHARRTGRTVLYAAVLVVGVAAATVMVAIAGVGSGRGGGDDTDPAAPGASAQAASSAGAEAVGVPAPIRVEVLNGSGIGGLAREATHRLRADGFDVVFFGNATRFDHGRSVVLDRTGDTVAARSVANALGIDSIGSTPDARLLLDVTVVLGSDWPPAIPERLTTLERLRRLITPGDSAR
jgi:hypothetical protein